MNKAIGLVVLFLAGCNSKPDLTCAIIHRPKGGCPQGYVQEHEPRFTERDGSREFACLSTDPTKDACTDVLKAGESEHLRLNIVPGAPRYVPPPVAQDKL